MDRRAELAGRIVGSDLDGEVAPPSELAFEALFAAEHERLFRALYLITGETDTAEELMQDAFLKVWERWDRVSRMESPRGYLFRTAINGAWSRYRALLRAARHNLPLVMPEDEFAVADLRDALVRAVRALPRRQRSALVLTDYLGFGADDAASLLGVKPSTVRSLAAQARAQLRGVMEAGRG